MDIGLGDKETFLQGLVLPVFGYFIIGQRFGNTLFIFLAGVQLVTSAAAISWIRTHLHRMNEDEDTESVRDTHDHIGEKMVTSSTVISITALTISICLYLYSLYLYWNLALDIRLVQLLGILQAILLVQTITDAIYGWGGDVQFDLD